MTYNTRFRPLGVLGAFGLAVVTAVLVYSKTLDTPEPPHVSLLRTPDGGIQPQTVISPEGALHMIYFKGDPDGGDIEYVRRLPGSAEFSKPLRVNSQPGSAEAVGTVRGPQMTVGRNGRVCVVWFGSSKADPHGPAGASLVLFSRLNDRGTAFEPQRCPMQYPQGVDWGGLSVAADRGGDVFVVWHGPGSAPGEAHGRVYLARSNDDGRTFAREVAISPAALGACGCCGMRALADQRGRLLVSYRAAAQDIHRDMTLLVSEERGKTFRSMRVDSWLLKACPVSTAYLNEGADRVLAAWETAGEVYFDEIKPSSFGLSSAIHPPGRPNGRKYPAVAANGRGWVLLSWTQGTGWMKGGSLAWQLFDRSGHPVGAQGHAPGVPVWDLLSVFADRAGNFTVVY